jgi:UDP-N-acetylglucosamine 4,6-dehydratase/5-epimerase
MRVTDLARCIAPDCRLNFVGIRSGEKLHEVMVVEEDARQTIQLPDRFVVIPSQPFKVFEETREWQAAGPRCPEGFRYGSDTNDRWLSGKELTSMIAGLDLPEAREFARERSASVV